jgi:hypothetical protein
MKRALIWLAICLLIIPVVFARDNKNNETDKTIPKERGKGLSEAIKHVPDFVAEKLMYMSNLFSNGVRGIGKSLSDWIHTFFKPVIKKNETQNQSIS